MQTSRYNFEEISKPAFRNRNGGRQVDPACFRTIRRRNKNEACENMPVVVNRTRALFLFFFFFAVHLVCTVSVNNSGRHRFYIPTGSINQVRREPGVFLF